MRAKPTQFKVLPLTKIPKSVLLIDDVVTTGSTLAACATSLKQAGVKTVHAAVFAHSG